MQLLLITLTVLQSLFTTLEQKTLISDFTITITDGQSPMTYTGELAMHGKQFTLSMFGIEAAYDGSTLYMYNEDIEELSLSTPTEEELIQTNPFLYAQALLPVCQYAEQIVNNQAIITLIPSPSPNNPIVSSPIKKFILRVITATLLPTVVEIHEEEGKCTILRFSNAQLTTTPPAFTISKEGVFINDLR